MKTCSGVYFFPRHSADAYRPICKRIRGQTADPVLLQASVYIADVIKTTATFLSFL